MQAAWAGRALKEPAGHCAHCAASVAPSAALAVPAAQGVHCVSAASPSSAP